MKKPLIIALTTILILTNFTSCDADPPPAESPSISSTPESPITSSTPESSTPESDVSNVPEPQKPDGEPTFLTAPDGTPIYTSEITKYQNPAEYHGTHEQFPLDTFNMGTFTDVDCPEVVCDGFAYAFIPRFNINYNEAPDKFEEWDNILRYTGEEFPAASEYFRLKVGDKFGSLTVKSAQTLFSNYSAQGYSGDPAGVPGIYLTGAEIQYEGTVEMTGCMQVMETIGYSTSGDLSFYPDSNCVSKIPSAYYELDQDHPEFGICYRPYESWGAYGDLSEIILGNMNDFDVDFDGLQPGDNGVHVKVGVKDPRVVFRWGYMSCGGEPVHVEVLDR